MIALWVLSKWLILSIKSKSTFESTRYRMILSAFYIENMFFKQENHENKHMFLYNGKYTYIMLYYIGTKECNYIII